MTEVIASIDEWTDNNFPDLRRKLWGFCEQSHRTVDGVDQPIIMTINGTSDRKNVTLDDRYQFITWFRMDQGIGVANNDEWSFGFKEARFNTARLRWVIAHRVELGENLIYSLVNGLPEQWSVNGFQFVFTKPEINIDYDHETIYRTELGNTVYEKHRFPWNLYVINLDIEFILCEGYTSQSGCCEDSLLAESGDCLITEE